MTSFHDCRVFLGRAALSWCIGLLLVLAAAGRLAAAPTSADQAAAAVAGWLAGSPAPLGTPLGGKVARTDTFTDASGAAVYYVVYLDPAGFVIVPADDLVWPIVGWAAGGKYDPAPANPLGALVGRDVPDRVALAQRETAGAKGRDSAKPTAAQQRWAALTAAAAGDAAISSVSEVWVDPLVQSEWDQSTASGGACYNYYTPPYAAGSSSNYVCGCVATAQAQLMRFWQWPTTAIGTAGYTIYVDGSSQTYHLRGGDGDGGAYSWSDMTLVPADGVTTAGRQAIGALCADVGATVAMSYTSGSSGTDTLMSADSLRDAYSYSRAVKGYNGGSNLPEDVRNAMVNPNLEAGFPVLFGITGPYGGHAIVCDGYGYESDVMYHHLNMGWSGNSNMWYDLPDIGTGYQFQTIYKCVYNVFTEGAGEIICGRLVDFDGAALADETVTATAAPDISLEATTDAHGVFVFAKVPSATAFTLTCSPDGYRVLDTTVTTGTSTDYGACGNVYGLDLIAVAGAAGTLQVTLEPAEAITAGALWRAVGATWTTAWLPSGTMRLFPAGDVDIEFQSTPRWTGPATRQVTVTDGGDLAETGTFTETSRVRYVKQDATGAADGTSWADAYTDLAAALATGVAGDDFWVARGTYYPSATGDRDATFAIPGNVYLFGGFAGTETSVDQRNWGLYRTILSGDLDNDDTGTVAIDEPSRADNSSHVVRGADLARLDGVIVTGGNALTTDNYPYAGGMLNWEVNPTIANTTFIANASPAYGGAVLNFNNEVSFTDCTFTNNGCAGDGGAVADYQSITTFTRCTFSGNVAAAGGGAIYAYLNDQDLSECEFRGNATGTDGGAVALVELDSHFTNALFYGNEAANGGAVALVGGTTYLRYCTLSGNTAATSGGGIYNTDGYASVMNCVLWGDGTEVADSGTGETNVNYCCIEGGHDGLGNKDEDPNFLDSANGELYLVDPSPAIDAADTIWVPPTDLDGNAREVAADMGCYEYSSATAELTVTILPQAAIDAGAQWRVDSGAWQDSAATVTGLGPGHHPVEFKELTNWLTPATQSVSTPPGQSVDAYGLYEASGTVTVTIAPQEAIDDGARWRLDAGEWQTTGTTLGTTAGDHTVRFESLAGWTRPTDEPVTVSVGADTPVTGTYTQLDPLALITTSPLPTATRDWAYSCTFEAAGGQTPYTWQLVRSGDYTESDSDATWLSSGAAQGAAGDDTTVEIDLPWTFTYYGIDYTSVYACSNGFLDFVSNATDYEDSIAELIGNVRIAALWEDLATSDGDIYFASTDAYAVIRWEAEQLSTGYPTVFEVILYRSGDIAMVYSNVDMITAAPTIGISAGDGVNYVTSSLNGNTNIPDGTATVFAQEGALPPGLAFNPATAILAGTPTLVGNYTFTIAVADSAEIPSSVEREMALAVEPPPAALEVTLAPQSAIDAGAQWRADEGAWQDSGVTLIDLGAGAHTVEFKDIANYHTPAPQNVTLVEEQTVAITGTYVGYGSVQVTIEPQGAIDDGARWRVDGGAWQDAGTTLTPVDLGDHTIDFQLVDGWSAPAARDVTVEIGQTATSTGTYIQVQPLVITTTALPDGAADEAYDETLTATGGLTPYRWALHRYGDYTETDSGDGWLGGGTARDWAGDDSSWPLELPWAFTFYGTAYTSVHVCSNGFLDFTSTSTDRNNSTTKLLAAVRIAPFWDDLIIDGDHDVYVTATDDYVAVRWDTRPYGSTANVDFEAVLYRSGDIVFNYYDCDNVNFSPTIGISAGDQTNYLISDLDGTARITTGTGRRFAQEDGVPPGLALDPLTGVLSGTPTAAGDFSFTVQLSDAATPQQNVDQILTLNVVPAPASIQVTIVPAAAIAAGAQWRLDDGTWQDSGTTIGDLAPGDYTITFSDVADYRTPGPVNASPVAGQAYTHEATYAGVGSVTVTLAPAGAIDDGARWRVDGGAWQESGATVGDLLEGDHEVDYLRIDGWDPPAAETLAVSQGDTATTTGTYAEHTPVVFYVNHAATGGGDGSSWADAFTDLQDALGTAVYSDEIRVAAGTYRPGTGRTDTFAIPNGVGLYGGFLGTETERSQRDSYTNETILSGDLTANDSGAVGPDNATRQDNAYHVVSFAGSDQTTVLDGFTVTGGNANGADTADSGGGLFIDGGRPMIEDCRLVDNAAVYGGAMLAGASQPQLNNCLITGNVAGEQGGALFNAGPSTPLLVFCTVSGNSAATAGGAVYDAGAMCMITNSVVWGNGDTPIVSTNAQVSYSCIEGGFAGTAITADDPRFVAADDFRLQLGSPCLDSGQTNVEFPTADIRGAARDDTPDMGAYEGAYVRLDIASLNPASGVNVILGVADEDGNTGGPTPFYRIYAVGTNVPLTAPATSGMAAFTQWRQDDTLFADSRATSIESAESTTLTAVYSRTPTITGLAAGVADEGSATSLSATLGDADNTTVDVTIDWGDGSDPEATAAAPVGVFAANHTYPDNGTYTITVEASDDYGAATTAQTTALVGNLPPANLSLSPLTGTEDTPYSGTLTATDIAADPLTWSKTAGAAWLAVAANGAVTGTPPENGSGNYSLTAKVNDGDGGNATRTFTIAIAPVNDPPSIAGFTATPGNEGAASTLSATLADVDNATLTVTINWGDGGPPQVLANTPVGTFSRQHVYADDGEYAIDIEVSDGAAADTDSTTVTVPNVAPANLALTPLTGTEDTPYSGTLTATDIDALTWTKTGGAAWLSVAANGAVTGTPTNADTGSQTLSVSVSDGDGGVVPETFTITVTAVNDPPTVADLSVPGVDEGVATTLSAALADVDNATLTVTVDWGDGGTPEVLANTPVGTFSRQHTYADDGSYTVEVTVNDGAAEDSAQTNVTIANVAPADLALTPLTGSEDTAYSGTLTATDIDTLTWSKTGGAAWLSVAANGAVTGTPTNADTGDQSLTVAVDDGVVVVPETFTITVAAVNDPPTIADLSIGDGDEGATSTLTAALADVDSSALTVTVDWGDGGDPEQQTGVAPGPFQQQYTYANSGQYTVTLTVSDGDLQDVDTATVTIANVAPVDLALAPLTGTEDVAYSGTLTATDIDALTWSKTGGASWIQVAANGAVTGTPTNSDTGDQALNVAVTDGDGGTTTATFTIAVTAVNDPPTIADLTATPGAEGTASTLAATLGDVDNTSLTVTVDWGDGGDPVEFTEVVPGAFEQQHTYADDGDYTVTITVADADTQVEDETGMAVPNVAPANLALTPLTGTEDTPYSGALTAADVDALTWSKTGGAAWLSVAANGAVTGTPTNADTGSQTLSVSVSDGDGGVVPETFTITVTAVNDAPTVADLSVQGADESVATTLAATLADIDNATLTVTVDWGDGGDPEVLANTPVGAFTRQHTYADDGSYTVEVTVNDGTAENSAQTNVTITNVAPADLALTPLTGSEDVAYSGTLTATDIDPLTWSKTGGAAWLSVAANGAVTGTPTNADTGSQTLEVAVSDGDGGEATETFTITVAPVNDPPTITGLSVTPANEGGTSTLTATLADIDSTALTVTVDWGDGSDPEPFTDVAPGAFQAEHSFGDNGQYTVTLTVSDGELQDVETTAVTIANVAPADLALTPLTGTEDVAYTGTLSATDVDTLTWSKTGGASWLSVSADGVVTGTPTNSTTGNQGLDVSVTDGDGGTTTASFTIVVTAVNDTPTIAGLTATPGPEGTASTLAATLGDIDDTALTVTVDWGDGSDPEPFNDVVPGSFSRQHTYADNGSYTVGLTVGDGLLTADDTTTMAVPNVAPTDLALAPLTGTEDTPYTGTLTATDVDDLVWSKTGGAAWLQVAGNGAVTGTPTNADTGSQSLQVSVNDGDGGVRTQSFLIQVLAVNDPPTIANLAMTPGNEGAASTLAAVLGDVDSTFLTVTIDWGDGSDPQALANVQPGNFQWQHTYADSGEYAVGVTVGDGELDAEDTTSVTVPNLPPASLALAPLTGTEDTAYVGALTATDVDPLVWSKTGGPAWVQVAANGAVTGTPTNADTGNQTFQVSVNDGDGGEETASFSIVVTAVNDPPTIAGLAATPGNEGAVTTVQATLGDVDNDTLTVTVDWGDDSMPDEFTGVPLGSFQKQHTYADNGDYTIEITIDDGTAETAATTAAAVPNLPPASLALAPLTGTEDTAYTGSLTATDVDSLTWTKTGGAAWIRVAANGAVTGTPTNDDTGDQDLEVSVSDGDGGEETASFTIAVTAVNDPPTIADLAATPAGEGLPSTLAATLGDVDNDTLTVTVDWGDGSDAEEFEDVAPGDFEKQHTYANNGDYTVAIKVADDDTEVEAETELAVPNIAPADLALAPLAGIEDTPYAGTLTATDGDTLTWSKTAGAAWLSVSADGVVTGTPTNSTTGNQTLHVSVNDGDGGVRTASFTITVTPVNDPPTVTDLTVTPADEGKESTLTCTVGDIDSTVLTVTVDWGDGGVPEVVPNVAPGPFGRGHFYADSGPATVTVTVSDGALEAEAEAEITIPNVAPANPELAPLTGTEDTPYTGALTAEDVDTLTWSKTGGAAWIQVAGNGAVTGTPTNDDTGSQTLEVSVADGDGGVTPASFTIEIAPVDDPPTIAELVATGADEGGQSTLTATLGDVDSDLLTVTVDWGDGSTPKVVPAVAPGPFSLIHTYANSGTYTIELTAADDTGETSDTTPVEIANVAPANLALTPLAGMQGVPYSGTLTATDVDALTWSKTAGPAWLTVAANGAVTGTPGPGDSGDQVLEVAVEDADGAGVGATFTIVVRAVIEYPLAAGYTLIGLPLTDTGMARAADLLARLPEATAVYAYAAATQTWLTYTRTGGTNFVVTPGMGCFVACPEAATAAIDGFWTDHTMVDIRVGYNVLCMPGGPGPRSASAVMAGMGATGVWTWDVTAQKWVAWLQGFGGTDFPCEPGTPFMVALPALPVAP